MSYRDRVQLGRPSAREIYGAMTQVERILFWTAIVNFIVFVGVAVPLGGDAINGTARDGYYYLMQHGVYTKVSKSIFIYSTIHTLTLLVTHPVGFVVAIRARFRLRKQGPS